MERLTKRIDGSIVFPSDLVGVTLTPDNEIMHTLLCRLASYEDTGMLPEEIMVLCEMDKRGKMAKMLRWEEAEQDGRLVVLPCKIGADIYRVGEKEVFDCWQIVKAEIYEEEIVLEDDSGNIIYQEDIGESVFLTREEAEAALQNDKS